MKKVLKKQSCLALLDSLGKTALLPEDMIEFIQKMMYKGNVGEDLVDTRVRLYKAMKTKSSLALPPDPDSMRQAILRVHYQCFYWLRFHMTTVPQISLESNGWTVDLEDSLVFPVWFTCDQMPKKQKEQKKRNQFDQPP